MRQDERATVRATAGPRRATAGGEIPPVEESLWRARLVGARVRVTLAAGRRCEDMPHVATEDGKLGVVRCECGPDGPRHPWLVQFDRAVAWSIRSRSGPVDVPLVVRYYAPDELDVLG